MNRTRFLFLALAVGTSGCFPGIYYKRISGKLVDENGKPMSGATILLTVNKECGSVGGRSAELMSAVVNETAADGSFNTWSAGGGLLYYILIGGCGGFSKNLETCKDGHWVTVHYERPDGGFVKTNAEGSYVFIAPKPEGPGQQLRINDWPRGVYSKEIREQCLRKEREKL